jgi:hypothetical protein
MRASVWNGWGIVKVYEVLLPLVQTHGANGEDAALFANPREDDSGGFRDFSPENCYTEPPRLLH